ncbi:30S ribosomal protein S6 modification protein [Vibrio palustris]|uniref:30S ribosomal protein S6 modification protein n=1 Tax=Vibrio palustris TaxID=1918946 RepID=A0A1R4B2T2_9VIBR|nr:30S ribosomal protein S6 modification protein [Vibrio palustris]SJL83211.1 hypothetical protein VPAL9027_01160 [Vibrio palustris]
MFNQSKILVWYAVSNQKVLLGEVLSHSGYDMASLWRGIPFYQDEKGDLGYRLSLFDADGREIGAKAVSSVFVEDFLLDVKKARV